MTTPLNWTVYYPNGSPCREFSNLDGEWVDAPREGVQVIAVEHPIMGRKLHHNTDHYAYAGGQPYQCDDLTQWIRDHVPAIKYGTMVSDEEYQECLDRADIDPRFRKLSPRRRCTD